MAGSTGSRRLSFVLERQDPRQRDAVVEDDNVEGALLLPRGLAMPGLASDVANSVREKIVARRHLVP